jgi:hypothetical protein
MVLASFIIPIKAFEGNSVPLPRMRCLLFQALSRARKHAEFGAHWLKHQQSCIHTSLHLEFGGAQIPVVRSSGQVNFVRWRLIFVGPQHGICFMSPFWGLEF